MATPVHSPDRKSGDTPRIAVPFHENAVEKHIYAFFMDNFIPARSGNRLIFGQV